MSLSETTIKIYLKNLDKSKLQNLDKTYASTFGPNLSKLFGKAGVSVNSRSRPFPRMKASDCRSRITGMDFFMPFPFPNFGGNAFLSFPSRSWNVGMTFLHSLPVPELWESTFFIPFPLPDLLFHRWESKRELDYCKRYQASNFFSFLYNSQNNYIEEVNWAKMFKSE